MSITIRSLYTHILVYCHRQVVSGGLFLFLVVILGVQLPFTPFMVRQLFSLLSGDLVECINIGGAFAGFAEGLSKNPEITIPLWKNS